MITLYHGSYTKVDNPFISHGRRNLDFGQGFYLTSLLTQAQKWAKIVSSRKSENAIGVVNIFQFDDDACKADQQLKFKVFPEYNLEWLDFVVNNRNGNNSKYNYDVVEGGVANDQVIDTIEDYEAGRITSEQALDQLRYKKPNHQICFRNQTVIDKYLHFTGIIEYKEDDKQ